MNVLVDSTIWSLALRRKIAESRESSELTQLIRRGEARLIGAVRQEVLSGISSDERFVALRDRLRSFPDLPLTQVHYERAAIYCNLCRTRGIQGSPTDFLLCAASVAYRFSIFTTDKDFGRYADHLPIQLHDLK
jgi:predicted nucleic acid-binding protein